MSGYMSPMVAATLLAAYFMLSIEIYLATSVLSTFRMAFFKLGPTELRLILAFGTLVLFVHPHGEVFGRQYLLFDIGGVVAAIGPRHHVPLLCGPDDARAVSGGAAASRQRGARKGRPYTATASKS